MISLAENFFYMGVPGKVFGDTYPKITDTVNRLQYFAVKGILGQDRLSGSANVQNLTFTGIEFHVPSCVAKCVGDVRKVHAFTHQNRVMNKRNKVGQNKVRYSIVLNSIQINLFCNCMKNVRLISKYNCVCQKRDKLQLQLELVFCIPIKFAYKCF